MFRRSMKSTIIKQRQTKGNKSFFLVMEFVPVSTLAKIAHRVKKKYFRFRYSPSLVKSNIRNRAIPFVACIRVYFQITPQKSFLQQPFLEREKWETYELVSRKLPPITTLRIRKRKLGGG